jgi:hypothetical protein
MKHKLFLLLVMTAITGDAFAQDSTTNAPAFLRARAMTRGGRATEAWLYTVTDTTLLLSWEKRLPRLYDTTRGKGIQSFGYKDLEYVTYFRRGAIGRSILIGFVIGAATGAIAGFASGDDPPGFFALTAGEKALAVGLFGGAVGTITGLIIGAASHRTFIINGRRDRFARMSQKLAARLGQ